MDSFGNICIFLKVFVLLFATEIAQSGTQCDCESLSFLTELVQQEIFQRKLDYMKLRSELRRISKEHKVVTQPSAGTTQTIGVGRATPTIGVGRATPTIGVSGLEKDKPTQAVEYRLDYLEKQLKAKESGFEELEKKTNEIFRTKAKMQASFHDLEERTNEILRSNAELQSGLVELERRTNNTLRLNAERNLIFQKTLTIALKKEKHERINFVTRVQTFTEDNIDSFDEFKRNITNNVEDFKITLTSHLEKHVLKVDQDLESQRDDTELMQRKVSNEMDKLEGKVIADIAAAGERTALSIKTVLNTVKNLTENTNECIADIVSIRNLTNYITSDTEEDKMALTELRNNFDDNVVKVNGIYSFIIKKHRDCKAILRIAPYAKSGPYVIFLEKSNKALDVYCDMETDKGGWTVFQRRYDGQTDFYRNYTEYEKGFGSTSGEFWLGLKNIKELAEDGVTELRYDVTSINGEELNEIFKDFKLTNNEYRLQLGSHGENSGYKGNSGMLYNNGEGFSTYDHDVDTSLFNCASGRKGAWWYEWCSHVDLNAVYSTSWRCMNHNGLTGGKCLKSSRMMIRRTT